ncbi:MAG: sigma-70 family RNA polymerase sigma factor [Ardenticatenaceae bacterium]|nr:sigma-70 family RNA polymerase sigma factor [Ardenticatenaceae bacterium]
MSSTHQSISALAKRCQQETSKYRAHQPYTMRYCMALFKLAFERKSEDAFTALYRLYGTLVRSWVMRHPIFPSLNLPAEYFVADSMSEFFLAMSQTSLDRFDSIGAIFAYWRKCVHSVLTQARRKQQKQIVDQSIDDLSLQSKGDRTDAQLDAAMLWERIEKLLEVDDLLLARYALIQNLKPRQIVELSENKWTTTNEVRVALQRVKRQLQRDPQLRLLLGIED